jgi:hypothetical protein
VAKRITISCLVLAMVLTVGAPLALAASDSQAATAMRQRPNQSRWQPFPVYPVWGQKPARGTGLDYYLNYSADTNELILYVVNATNKDITVRTPTSQKTDFVLWQNGQVVYRASSGQSYEQAVTRERFRPGQGKVYKQALPALPTGTYFAQAYFIGETTSRPVASNYFWIQAKDPLNYNIEFINSGWFNQGPRLKLTIKNESGRDIWMPYQYGYQVLVKRPGANEYLGNVGIGQSIGSIQNGASRYVFVNVGNLRPGLYQADVRSNLSGGAYRIVAQTWFYVH